MPLLQELPPGQEGIDVAWSSVKLVIMVIALFGYSYIGIMGAAAFGAHTEGDIMMNKLIGNRAGAAVLAVAVLVYIASCIPPLIVSMRCYIDFMVAGPNAGYQFPRFFIQTVLIVFLPMCVAMFDAGASRAAFAVTGSTGVCIVCYIIPVVVHASLRRETRKAVLGAARADGIMVAGNGVCSDLLDPLLVVSEDAACLLERRETSSAEICFSWVDDVLPWVVLLMGCVFSALALKGVLFGL